TAGPATAAGPAPAATERAAASADRQWRPRLRARGARSPGCVHVRPPARVRSEGREGLVTGRRRFLRLAGAGTLALALAGAPALALAGEVQVTVTLGSTQVEVGQSVYMQVEVETDGGRIGQPRFSGLDDVTVVARGTSSGTSIQVGGGQRFRRATKTFTYLLSPHRAGEFEIEVEVEVDGEDHRPAEKPTLIATGEPVQSVIEQGKAGDRPDDPTAEVIVWPVVDKASAYVGEQI